MKVVIVGGGVMGMMQARELSQKGWQVTLVDKGLCGSEASWAGGGIVSPLYPWRYPQAITTLASWSQAYYPNLIQSLEAESGVDPELTRHGMLVLDLHDRDEALKWAESVQPNWIEQIDDSALYRLESKLKTGYEGAMWMPQVCSVRNPRLLRALGTSLRQDPNVEIVEQTPVSGLDIQQGVVKGVKGLDGSSLSGDAVLLCSGAWSSELLAEFSLRKNDVEIAPVKGQMLIFDAKPGLLNRVVLSNGKYLIPRRDGQILAGSTVEYEGFNKDTTTNARELLASAAREILPELISVSITHHWAGLRPGSPKGIPSIGKVPEVQGLYINAGHFRNGLVLAPASVRLMSSILCGEPEPFSATPYQPKMA